MKICKYENCTSIVPPTVGPGRPRVYCSEDCRYEQDRDVRAEKKRAAYRAAGHVPRKVTCSRCGFSGHTKISCTRKAAHFPVWVEPGEFDRVEA